MSHRYVVEGLHHASLESGSLELQDDAEGQQDSDACHAGGAQDSIEEHVTMSLEPVQL